MADEPPTPKPRGRPRAEQPGSGVSAWLRADEHDRLIRLASKHELSVSQMIRVILKRVLR